MSFTRDELKALGAIDPDKSLNAAEQDDIKRRLLAMKEEHMSPAAKEIRKRLMSEAVGENSPMVSVAAQSELDYIRKRMAEIRAGGEVYPHEKSAIQFLQNLPAEQVLGAFIEIGKPAGLVEQYCGPGFLQDIDPVKFKVTGTQSGRFQSAVPNESNVVPDGSIHPKVKEILSFLDDHMSDEAIEQVKPHLISLFPKPKLDDCFGPLLNRSLRRLTNYYKQDKTAPGIHTAWLPDKGRWYCSVKRFKGTETILANAVGETLDDAITKAMATWVEKCAAAGYPVSESNT